MEALQWYAHLFLIPSSPVNLKKWRARSLIFLLLYVCRKSANKNFNGFSVADNVCCWHSPRCCSLDRRFAMFPATLLTVLVSSLWQNAIYFTVCRLSMFSFNFNLFPQVVSVRWTKKKRTSKKMEWWNIKREKTHSSMSQLFSQVCLCMYIYKFTNGEPLQCTQMHAVTLHAPTEKQHLSCQKAVVGSAREESIFLTNGDVPVGFRIMKQQIKETSKTWHQDHWMETNWWDFSET